MQHTTTQTIMSTGKPEVVPVDKSLVRMVVKYPKDWKGPKFYKDGQIIHVSAESAAEFEGELKMAKVAPEGSESEALTEAKEALVEDIQDEAAKEQIEADKKKLAQAEAAELAMGTPNPAALLEEHNKQVEEANKDKTHTSPLASGPGAPAKTATAAKPGNTEKPGK